MLGATEIVSQVSSGTPRGLALKYSIAQCSATAVDIEIGSMSLNIILEGFQDRVQGPPMAKPGIFKRLYLSSQGLHRLETWWIKKFRL